MDRRSFLVKGASLLGGYLLGLSGFSHVYAFEKLSPSYSLNPSIALIIDDIGLSESQASQFLQLNIPLSFAILPRMKYSTILAREISDRGHEIMLHQPMEPGDPRVDPGPGALYVGDNPNTINRIIEENIAELPLATGINNHMGSRFTESREKMTETLRVVKESGLFFVDSRTSQHSKGYRVARTLRMPAAYRHIFLDNYYLRTGHPGAIAQIEAMCAAVRNRHRNWPSFPPNRTRPQVLHRETRLAESLICPCFKGAE